MPSLEEKFWARVNKHGGKAPHMESDCYEWTGAVSSSGYGGVSVLVDGARATRLPHRVSWELHSGPIPRGLLVCHRCDVPLCVRPDHLFLGTDKENVADALSKGRRPRASIVARPPRIRPERKSMGRKLRTPASFRNRTTLTPDQVSEMRRLYEAGEANQPELGRRFGIRKDAVSKIIRRIRWRDI